MTSRGHHSFSKLAENGWKITWLIFEKKGFRVDGIYTIGGNKLDNIKML